MMCGWMPKSRLPCKGVIVHQSINIDPTQLQLCRAGLKPWQDCPSSLSSPFQAQVGWQGGGKKGHREQLYPSIP